ncbi:MAG: hypothetical protein WBF51_04170 [Candidatus Dormiibacterota bacterium]
MSNYTILSADTHTVFNIAPVQDTNSASPGSPISLTGAVSAATRWQLQNGTAPAFSGTGTAAIVSPNVTYKPSAAPSGDLGSPPGLYLVYLLITYSDGTVLPAQPFLVNLLASP